MHVIAAHGAYLLSENYLKITEPSAVPLQLFTPFQPRWPNR
jgi:hypothetical protein